MQRRVAQFRRVMRGIEVAMPTAMPCAPFASRFGNAPGRTKGSFDWPS
jgi:hypothetical protein